MFHDDGVNSFGLIYGGPGTPKKSPGEIGLKRTYQKTQKNFNTNLFAYCKKSERTIGQNRLIDFAIRVYHVTTVL